MSLQNNFLSFFKRFHILIVLSQEPETIYLLSLVTAIVLTEEVWPRCFLSLFKRFPYSYCVISRTRNNIIVVACHCPLFTPSKCPRKTASCLFFERFHILIALSLKPEIMYFLSLVAATLFTLPKCSRKTASCLFLKDFRFLLFYLSSQK